MAECDHDKSDGTGECSRNQTGAQIATAIDRAIDEGHRDDTHRNRQRKYDADLSRIEASGFQPKREERHLNSEDDEQTGVERRKTRAKVVDGA
jgi:hypothetical protein